MNVSNFYKYRLDNIVSCSQPLVAISSVMRSGGNLLNRLFDGHLQLRTYHSEFLFGVMSDITLPKNHILNIQNFPLIDNRGNVEDIFDQLSQNDPFIRNAIESGWVKVNYNSPKPFFYDAQLHKRIFLKIYNNTDNTRNILNKYITSYFNSYIDYQELYSNDKLFTTTYWPGFITSNVNIERFCKSYPDGFIVGIVRNPLQWAGSAKRRRPKDFDYNYMDALWKKSIDNSVEWSKINNNVILVDFDSLVNNTSNVMDKLCKLIGIKYSNSLCMPTFNSMPIEGNSINKENQKVHIVKEVLNTYNTILNNSEVMEITERYLPTYHSANKL